MEIVLGTKRGNLNEHFANEKPPKIKYWNLRIVLNKHSDVVFVLQTNVYDAIKRHCNIDEHYQFQVQLSLAWNVLFGNLMLILVSVF